jgi:co-chaperonin GroES (HSP10)|tara:strand:+ start:1186 stop:1464 length:279 start_codon:yes stop_codon:yes gene_type:complete
MAKKKETFKPLRDWILLPDPRKTKTESGIILSDTDRQKMTTNVLKVLDIGPEVKHIKKGDTVMVDPSVAGMIIDINETSHVLVSEFHCLGIM